jgi:hypothetical protein
MNQPDPIPCRWCEAAIGAPKAGQKFCCANHRYLWHKAQRISPARFDERVRSIVREELRSAGITLRERLASDRASADSPTRF